MLHTGCQFITIERKCSNMEKQIQCPWCMDTYHSYSFVPHLENKKCYLEELAKEEEDGKTDSI